MNFFFTQIYSDLENQFDKLARRQAEIFQNLEKTHKSEEAPKLKEKVDVRADVKNMQTVPKISVKNSATSILSHFLNLWHEKNEGSGFK